MSSGEIPKLSEDLKSKERKLEDIENGDKGLSKLWSNLTEMNRKVSCHFCPTVLKPAYNSHCHILTRETVKEYPDFQCWSGDSALFKCTF